MRRDQQTIEEAAAVGAAIAAIVAFVATTGDVAIRLAYAVAALVVGSIAGWMVGAVIVWWHHHRRR